jgi:hypothetical protein
VTSSPPANPPPESASKRAVEKARIPCGVYRWRIKTLADPEAQSIRWKPIDTTIRDLVSMTSPAWFDRRKRNSSEFYVYRVRAISRRSTKTSTGTTTSSCATPTTPRARLVAEIPSPSCAKRRRAIPG